MTEAVNHLILVQVHRVIPSRKTIKSRLSYSKNILLSYVHIYTYLSQWAPAKKKNYK